MANPRLHPNQGGLGYGEVTSSGDITRRGLFRKTFIVLAAVALGVKGIDTVVNTRSELTDSQKLIIPDINKLNLESGEQLTRENKPSYLLEKSGIKPNRDGSYTLTSEDLAKSNIVVKFPDVRAPVPRAENKYLHIKISGIDFVTNEGNFSVVDK